ncbi:DUF6236 family protein [Frankia sp. AiPs1]|uniref:DUF6236 family protein n=1 Tax=Frankia sp. AiPs1 TaxID=573493 RepID=UPI0020442684|nr:DUF6236 family protein [Frankia sp. AiPs1]MCM3920285.1 DUF6236 family protein [Frankia sp. AiPs1]
MRDDVWLKAAALYWPRLAVLAPAGYPREGQSRTARVLRDEVGFLVDADPTYSTYDVAEEFLTLISRQGDALAERYAWLTDFPRVQQPAVLNQSRTVPVDDARVTWVHVGKVPPALVRRLVDTRLGVRSVDWGWLGMHPQLASVYLTALADRVAHANDLVPVTDQPGHLGVLNGWTVETLTHALLSDQTDRQPTGTVDDVSALYAAIAIQTVVPAGLADIPVAQIVDARRTLAAEFDAFREHLASLNDRFSELTQTEDPAILRARLEDLVEGDLARPLAELERGLRQLRWEPVRAVLGRSSLALPGVFALLPETARLPVVVGAGGMVAATLIGSGARVREEARDRRRSAAGYLLGLREELNPTGVVDRIRRVFRHASAPGNP